MKKYFIICMLLGVSLFINADITSNFRINQENSHIQFAGENAILTSSTNVYAVYCRKDNDMGVLELAVSFNNGANFSYYSIDTLFTQTPAKIKMLLPQLKKIDDSSVFIIYNKQNTDGRLNLYKAVFNTSLQAFTKSVLSENITSAPIISQEPGDFNVFYSRSFSEKATNYNLFTDTPKIDFPEQDNSYFWGADKFYGKVHSNGNIYMREGFSPVFHKPVTAHNDILYIDSEPVPLTNQVIFEQGAEENTSKKYLPDSADNLRAIANSPFDPTADIVYVKINGSNYQSMYAAITEYTEQIPVYSWYPADDDQARDIINNGGNWFEDATVIWTNNITKYDTLWTPGPSGVAENNQFWVESTLWIEGTITGMQTWGSSEDVYITSDILYTGTPVGNTPDGFNPQLNDYSDPVNANDYFGLITEGSIYIKYKHRDPFQNNILRDDNCSDVHLYGCYAAIGFGDTETGPDSWRNVSKFTFEYKYPHTGLKDFASISPYTLNDTIYTNAVYHRYILTDPEEVPANLRMYCLKKPTGYVQFPIVSTQTNARNINPGYHNNYPNANPSSNPPMIAFDLPGYNPAGPELESELSTERGDLYIYGSLILRRMSYTHISGADPDRHQNAEWNFDTCKFGSETWSAGYMRKMYYDTRFRNIDLPGIPYVNNTNIYGLSLIDETVLTETEIVPQTSMETNTDCFYANDGTLSIVAAQKSVDGNPIGNFDILTSTDNNGFFQYANLNTGNDNLILKDIDIYSGTMYFLFYDNNTENNILSSYDHSTNSLTEICQFSADYDLSDMDFRSNGNVVVAIAESGNDSQIAFYNEEDPSTALMYWNPAFLDDSSNSPASGLYLDISPNNDVQIAVQTNELENWGDLYIGRGNFNTTDTFEEVNTAEKFSISNFPNPFNPETTISFTIPEDYNVEITIYNMKGQKVKSLLNEKLKKGFHSVKWDGTDSKDKNVCSGVYLYKLKTNKKTQSLNKCLLLK